MPAVELSGLPGLESIDNALCDSGVHSFVKHVILYVMQTNVSELLRNFPKVRRAALAGERVVIHTREGNLILTAEKPAGRSLFGVLAATINSKGLSETDSGALPSDWEPSL